MKISRRERAHMTISRSKANDDLIGAGRGSHFVGRQAAMDLKMQKMCCSLAVFTPPETGRSACHAGHARHGIGGCGVEANKPHHAFE